MSNTWKLSLLRTSILRASQDPIGTRKDYESANGDGCSSTQHLNIRDGRKQGKRDFDNFLGTKLTDELGHFWLVVKEV